MYILPFLERADWLLLRKMPGAYGEKLLRYRTINRLLMSPIQVGLIFFADKTKKACSSHPKTPRHNEHYASLGIVFFSNEHAMRFVIELRGTCSHPAYKGANCFFIQKSLVGSIIILCQSVVRKTFSRNNAITPNEVASY